MRGQLQYLGAHQDMVCHVYKTMSLLTSSLQVNHILGLSLGPQGVQLPSPTTSDEQCSRCCHGLLCWCTLNDVLRRHRPPWGCTRRNTHKQTPAGTVAHKQWMNMYVCTYVVSTRVSCNLLACCYTYQAYTGRCKCWKPPISNEKDCYLKGVWLSHVQVRTKQNRIYMLKHVNSILFVNFSWQKMLPHTNWRSEESFLKQQSLHNRHHIWLLSPSESGQCLNTYVCTDTVHINCVSQLCNYTYVYNDMHNSIWIKETCCTQGHLASL